MLIMHILCEEESEMFDNLSTLESSVPSETKMSLVYIAGYITRKDLIYRKISYWNKQPSIKNMVNLLIHLRRT